MQYRKPVPASALLRVRSRIVRVEPSSRNPATKKVLIETVVTVVPPGKGGAPGAGFDAGEGGGEGGETVYAEATSLFVTKPLLGALWGAIMRGAGR